MLFWKELEKFGDAPALIDPAEGEVSYRELGRLADAFVAATRVELPESIQRPLLMVETLNEVAPIVTYLGALRAGWPIVLLADSATATDSRILEVFQPNYIFRRRKDGWVGSVANTVPVVMHPELRVLLSTSGTTGAPKLVRLSARNISANAASIAEYLGLGADERAITALPFHYSYGMSVLHTHLACGAALIPTNLSVAENEFWELFQRFEATSLALVPFQFELLEHNGFERMQLPSLRYITQAGGKLSEAQVCKFAALGRQTGWRFFVMYGQTEAAPRMAYLPSADAETWPSSIGRPVPGGRLELIDDDGATIEGARRAGELVYEGPNVMMGYAETRAALADKAGPTRLHTGDIAERLDNGYYRIVGRIGRFVKLFGLRLSLDEAEELLHRSGITAWCVGNDEKLVAFVQDGALCDAARMLLIERYRLTESVVQAENLDAPPLLSSGKVDYRKLRQSITTLRERSAPDDLGVVLKSALRTQTLDLNYSFSDLGGDSLSYIEVQLNLATRIGYVPANWEDMPLRNLLALTQTPLAMRRSWQPLSLDLVSRVISLAMVILLHTTNLPTAGGAYLLTFLVGASLARYQAARLNSGQIGAVLNSVLMPILLCYFGLITAVNFLWKPVGLEWFFLLGNFDENIHPRGLQPYWFVCLYVQAIVLVCLLFLVPRLRTFAAAHPFEAGVVVLVFLISYCELLELSETIPVLRLRHPEFALQLIALGWCCRYAGDRRKRLLVTVLLAMDVLLYWQVAPTVSALLFGGALAMIWVRSTTVPLSLFQVLSFIGMNVMFIYLTHPIAVVIVRNLFQVEGINNFLISFIASVLMGAAAKFIFDQFYLRAGMILTSAVPKRHGL